MQAGLTYTDDSGASFATAPLAPDYMACDHPDPDHSWMGGRVEYDNGAMDGFLRAGMNDQYAIGYYTEADRPFFNTFARTLHHLRSLLRLDPRADLSEPHLPTRGADRSSRQHASIISTLPTIWDRLAEEGVSGRYYFSDVPFLLLWGAKYLPILGTYDEFLADAAAGTCAERLVRRSPSSSTTRPGPRAAIIRTATCGSATRSSPRPSTPSSTVRTGRARSSS